MIPSTARSQPAQHRPAPRLDVPGKYADDARHVAACTVARHDFLVSWNFRHLANEQCSAGFNAVNLLQGWTSSDRSDTGNNGPLVARRHSFHLSVLTLRNVMV